VLQPATLFFNPPPLKGNKNNLGESCRVAWFRVEGFSVAGKNIKYKI